MDAQKKSALEVALEVAEVALVWWIFTFLDVHGSLWMFVDVSGSLWMCMDLPQNKKNWRTAIDEPGLNQESLSISCPICRVTNQPWLFSDLS